ncbi:Thioredoxin reductase-like selenoprotein T1b [Araneus ventricosus]|uniref:Thioredoxin reductase-like selenoprotein T1b n=1 Tax=Araneus ventricosus TaxID=182803 RepID=A0A4Y2RST0_ARAVE|nr:Thioredoxin reductase-like selenoprotein T1b [Araneus ventricosus]GBN78787.1 Thioredoxin reductase-like selenoprotein T1b [Araneus ventricosus]
MHLASLIGFVKWCVIAMVLANFNPFVALRMNTPAIFIWMTQNKLYACLMVFFLSNTIEGQLISTGAFEIIFNDVPVWSKIETGRIPSPPELFQIIEDNSFFRDTNPSSLRL